MEEWACRSCGAIGHAPRSMVGRYRFCSTACRSAHAASTAEARFWSKVDKEGPIPAHRPELGPCWLWTGGLFGNGYGRFSRAGSYELAHRAAWGFVRGPIPDGMLVLHACDVRRCVRPGHLFIGTQAINAADMVSKGRARHPHGEQHARARITADQAREIVTMCRAGRRQADVAQHFGVSRRQVQNIVLGKSWAHLNLVIPRPGRG